MEGLLKLEERMNRMEQGMDRDTKELRDKLAHVRIANPVWLQSAHMALF